MNTDGVSVVIPAYNSRAWLGDAIDSALAQSVTPLEIIVVDDGSTDDTGSLMKSYGARIRGIAQSNQGVAAARNTGIRAAAGSFVALLDADDVWHPRKLELQMNALAGLPDVGVLGTQRFDWPVSSMPEFEPPARPPIVRVARTELAVKNYLAASSVLLRRSVVEQVGAFDSTLRGTEDHDYWLRAAEFTEIANLQLPLMGYRCVPGSLSSQAAAMEINMRRVLAKLDACNYWRGDRLLRRRAYSYVGYSCAYLRGAAGDQAGAIASLLESIAEYPFPYRRAESGAPLGRLRRLAVQALRLLGLMGNNGASPACVQMALGER